MLIGDLNLLPNEVLRFLSRYRVSHGARAVTHDGRLDTYVSFPEEDTQVCVRTSITYMPYRTWTRGVRCELTRPPPIPSLTHLQLDYCLALDGQSRTDRRADDCKMHSVAIAGTGKTAADTTVGASTGKGRAGRGYWGGGATSLVGHAVHSDHLPIVTELQWLLE